MTAARSPRLTRDDARGISTCVGCAMFDAWMDDCFVVDYGVNDSPVEAERRALAELVGGRENAGILFRPKIGDEEAKRVGGVILEPLGCIHGTNSLHTNFTHFSDAEVTEWGSRCWANTVAHLCESDDEVRTVVAAHRTTLPKDEAAMDLIINKVLASFQFFLWAVASPTDPPTAANSCSIKLIVLSDAILLENIDAKRDGAFGGWGLLNKTIAGLRQVAAAFGIGRIKAIATNERVYRAFLRRGFQDRPEVEGLVHHVENYAKPVELIVG